VTKALAGGEKTNLIIRRRAFDLGFDHFKQVL